jgi:hypothetical protein
MLELNATALLDNVCSFVRSHMEIRVASECDLLIRGVRSCIHCRCTNCSDVADVGAHAGYVVTSK